MSNKESFEFIKSMTQYGIWLGSLIGAAGALPIALLWFDLSMLLPVLALGLIILMCGGLVGMIYGAVSGFISGLLMNVTTRFIFRNITQSQMYKLTMGFLALFTVALVFIFDMLFIGGQQADFFTRTIPMTDWLAIWLMSIAFAVYASQKTASDYLDYALAR